MWDLGRQLQQRQQRTLLPRLLFVVDSLSRNQYQIVLPTSSGLLGILHDAPILVLGTMLVQCLVLGRWSFFLLANVGQELGRELLPLLNFGLAFSCHNRVFADRCGLTAGALLFVALASPDLFLGVPLVSLGGTFGTVPARALVRMVACAFGS